MSFENNIERIATALETIAAAVSTGAKAVDQPAGQTTPEPKPEPKSEPKAKPTGKKKVKPAPEPVPEVEEDLFGEDEDEDETEAEATTPDTDDLDFDAVEELFFKLMNAIKEIPTNEGGGVGAARVVAKQFSDSYFGKKRLAESNVDPKDFAKIVKEIHDVAKIRGVKLDD